jgi:hypothetical protein
MDWVMAMFRAAGLGLLRTGLLKISNLEARATEWGWAGQSARQSACATKFRPFVFNDSWGSSCREYFLEALIRKNSGLARTEILVTRERVANAVGVGK